MLRLGLTEMVAAPRSKECLWKHQHEVETPYSKEVRNLYENLVSIERICNCSIGISCKPALRHIRIGDPYYGLEKRYELWCSI